jgi:DNA replication protein DnaC
MNLMKKSMKQNCWEYRKLANQCFYMNEDEFIDLLLHKHEEKIKYADFLEKEGSIMAESVRQKQNVFRMKDSNLGAQSQAE